MIVDAPKIQASVPASQSIADAFAYCEKMARSHYENFPVGSLLVPKSKRKHVYSIYAFARTADDFADEGYGTKITPGERLELLDDWESQLENCFAGNTQHPIFIALAETVRTLDLPHQLFRDLLSAFRQDVVKTRYANFDEVLDYCRRSANPVGRLILLLFGYRDEHLNYLSDKICTALQLANFWQDVSVDLQKDRIYLPLDDLARFNFSEADLRAGKCDERFVNLLKFQVARTWDLFKAGRPLPKLVSGRLSFELELTWQGGTRILELIEHGGFNTLNHRPHIGKLDKIVLFLKTVARR